VTVTAPATGLLPTNLKQAGVAVSWLTADANSRYSFSCDVPGVVVDFGAGSQVLYANEVPNMAIAAGGATNTAIDARMKWSGPGTVYALNQQILSPNNDVVAANVAHTSAAAFTTDVAKWVLSSTYLTPAADALVRAKVFTPEAYGAVGDGVADDTTAVNAAIAAANAAKGGTVYFAGTYKITSSLTCSGVMDVELRGTTRARTSGSGIVWAGADSGSTIKADNANGFSVIGLSFTATSATFAGRHIDFVNTTTMPQAFHILIEWCFFSGGAQLHTDIHTGGGHNYTIRLNDFYKSNIAIQGYQQSITPTQSVNSCLVERNWFESLRGTCHIADPGSGWKITCNAVECITGGIGGFVRLLNATPGLSNATIEDNWCGDVTTTVTSGAQIEVAAGPFTIRNNLLGAGAAGSASIRAVGIINAGCHIEDNRYAGSSVGIFIDWGAFAHIALGAPEAKSGSVYVLGNLVPNAVTLYAGTIPPRLVQDGGGVLTYAPTPVLINAAPAGTLAIDATLSRGGSYTTPAASITTMTVSNPTGNGQVLTIMLQQGSAGTLTTVWPANFRFAGGVAPGWTGAYCVTSVTMFYDAQVSRWREVSRAVNMPV